MAHRPVEDVLRDHTPALIAIPGVVGTYSSTLDDGTPCIVVMVARHDPAIERRLPDRIEGYPVRLDVSGVIRALRDSSR